MTVSEVAQLVCSKAGGSGLRLLAQSPVPSREVREQGRPSRVEGIQAVWCEACTTWEELFEEKNKIYKNIWPREQIASVSSKLIKGPCKRGTLSFMALQSTSATTCGGDLSGGLGRPALRSLLRQRRVMLHPAVLALGPKRGERGPALAQCFRGLGMPHVYTLSGAPRTLRVEHGLESQHPLQGGRPFRPQGNASPPPSLCVLETKSR